MNSLWHITHAQHVVMFFIFLIRQEAKRGRVVVDPGQIDMFKYVLTFTLLGNL